MNPDFNKRSLNERSSFVPVNDPCTIVSVDIAMLTFFFSFLLLPLTLVFLYWLVNLPSIGPSIVILC